MVIVIALSLALTLSLSHSLFSFFTGLGTIATRIESTKRRISLRSKPRIEVPFVYRK